MKMTPEEAMKRELSEEVGINKIEIVMLMVSGFLTIFLHQLKIKFGTENLLDKLKSGLLVSFMARILILN